MVATASPVRTRGKGNGAQPKADGTVVVAASPASSRKRYDYSTYYPVAVTANSGSIDNFAPLEEKFNVIVDGAKLESGNLRWERVARFNSTCRRNLMLANRPL